MSRRRRRREKAKTLDTGIQIADTKDQFAAGDRPLMAASADADPQRYDVAAGWNLLGLPRDEDRRLTPFEELRNLKRQCDLVKTCIATQVDEMKTIDWAVVAREDVEIDVSELVNEIERMLHVPDRINGLEFAPWVASVLEERLVTDAVAVRVIRDTLGRPHSFMQIDGSTVKPLLTSTFRTRPQPPEPAYQQIMQDNPWSQPVVSDYTTDQLLYAPQNVTVESPYGCSPVEQVLVSVRTAIHAFQDMLSQFDESTLPQAYVEIPDGMDPETGMKMIDMLNDVVAADRSKRFKFVPVPPGANVQQLREHSFNTPQMEFLARVICDAFGVSPVGLVSMMNRATAAVSETRQYDVGLAPRKAEVESIVNGLIRMAWGDGVAELVRFQFVTDKSDISLERASTLKEIQIMGWLHPSEISEGILGQEPDEAIRALPLGFVGGQAPAPAPASEFSSLPDLPEFPSLPAGDEVDEEVEAETTSGGAPITFNELTLGLDRLKTIGDEDLVNAARDRIAELLGAPKPPRLPITSAVEDEITVETTTTEDLESIKADLSRWRKVAKKDRKRAESFTSGTIPVEMQDRIRDAIRSGEDVAEIFAKQEEHRREGEKPFRDARTRLQEIAEELLKERSKAIIEGLVSEYNGLSRGDA